LLPFEIDKVSVRDLAIRCAKRALDLLAFMFDPGIIDAVGIAIKTLADLLKCSDCMPFCAYMISLVEKNGVQSIFKGSVGGGRFHR
jgi:hypothetical protein